MHLGGSPALPGPRGPLTAGLANYLGGDTNIPAVDIEPTVGVLWDDDFQLALYECYELHYRSFEGVSESFEWDPVLLGFRGELERGFLDGIQSTSAGAPCAPEEIGSALFAIADADDSPSLAPHLESTGTVDQFREFTVHRSAYQLKEADPHTWAIPRLAGPPKSALVEVQTDEYGSGDPARMHSVLFAKAMAALDLDPSYGAYVQNLPGTTLATVNLISLFGLHRRWRGALVGHLAMFEITSPGPNRRYASALRRLGLGDDALDFYEEHVEADSVHENIAAYDLAQGLAVSEPDLAPDILLGARALLHLDGVMAGAILAAWDQDRSSLLEGDAFASPR